MVSIFKKVRKGFKRLGSSIAKRMRKIGRGVKKGFKKLTKAFGKLGPLGHIALFFILPGMGNVLSSWMGQFGSKVMSMLPKNFSSILGRVGTAVKDAASWAETVESHKLLIPGETFRNDNHKKNEIKNYLAAGISYEKYRQKKCI